MCQGRGGQLFPKVCPDSPLRLGRLPAHTMWGLAPPLGKPGVKEVITQGLSRVWLLSPACRDAGPAKEGQRRKRGEVPHRRAAARGIRKEHEPVL